MRNYKIIFAACLIVGSTTWSHGLFAQGLVRPSNWMDLAPWDSNRPRRVEDLPTSFNWNDYAKLQPIRDQKSCGSCWAFSVVAVYEAVTKIVFPIWRGIDLSEQHLVSTCCDSGDCGGGFFDAFDCIRDDGVPWEVDNPYTARNSSCKKGTLKYSRLTRWSYIGDRGKEPTIAQLKKAIYEHGPISVDINGNLPYSGGIYKNCGSTFQNHMVTIEGWVDDPDLSAYGGGYWIMRNSWGDWGENGYARIVYNRKNSQTKCNGIAETAAYAVVDGVENLQNVLFLHTSDFSR